jgi:hypothetical protein
VGCDVGCWTQLRYGVLRVFGVGLRTLFAVYYGGADGCSLDTPTQLSAALIPFESRDKLSVVEERSAMLGWHISVYRQKVGGLSTPKGQRLAVWQTGLGGLDWLDELVKAGKAINLGENGGYPCRYTATLSA